MVHGTWYNRMKIGFEADGLEFEFHFYNFLPWHMGKLLTALDALFIKKKKSLIMWDCWKG